MSIRCNRLRVSFYGSIPESMRSERTEAEPQFVHRILNVQRINYCSMHEHLVTHSYMLLNMLSKAVNANPVANIDFIFTSDKSRLLFFSFSSSRSIFFLCCLSNESPRVSFRFSTVLQACERTHIKNSLLFSRGKTQARNTYIFCFVSQFHL